jgi:hypothetical protein
MRALGLQQFQVATTVEHVDKAWFAQHQIIAANADMVKLVDFVDKVVLLDTHALVTIIVAHSAPITKRHLDHATMADAQMAIHAVQEIFVANYIYLNNKNFDILFYKYLFHLLLNYIKKYIN